MHISYKWYAAGLIGCLALLGVAYFYFEQQLGLIPCPLCMLQRAALVLVAIFCLLGLLHRPRHLGHKIYSVLIMIASLLGAGIAGRQVWLQHLPADKVPECGFDPVYRWMQSDDGEYGLLQMLATALKGSGDCATVDWRFLGFSMAEWMLFIFIVMTLIALQLYKRQKRFFSY